MSKPLEAATPVRLELDAAHELRDAPLCEIAFGLRSTVAPGGLAAAIVDHSVGIAPAGTAPEISARGEAR